MLDAKLGLTGVTVKRNDAFSRSVPREDIEKSYCFCLLILPVLL